MNQNHDVRTGGSAERHLKGCLIMYSMNQVIN
uniref:Uncharacterized protein n=1 Tax=Arundo donax TaxID=35708 RepID=A0A0A9FZK7_ARUDO